MSIYVITDASQDIGLEFTRQISSKGNTVFACARNPDQSEELRQLTDNKSVYSVKLDMTCERSLEDAVQEISKHAAEGIDVLINNAEFILTKNNTEEATKDELIKDFETNETGVTETTKAFLPLLRKHESDRIKKILNISPSVGPIPNATSTRSAASMISDNSFDWLFNSQDAHNPMVEWDMFFTRKLKSLTDMNKEQADVRLQEKVREQLAKLDSGTEQDNGGYFDWQLNPLDY